MIKILVIVQGGIVQSVISTTPDNEVCIIDLDNIIAGDTNELLFNNVDVVSAFDFNYKIMYYNSMIVQNILSQEPEKMK